MSSFKKALATLIVAAPLLALAQVQAPSPAPAPLSPVAAPAIEAAQPRAAKPVGKKHWKKVTHKKHKRIVHKKKI
jgi:cytochrome c5